MGNDQQNYRYAPTSALISAATAAAAAAAAAASNGKSAKGTLVRKNGAVEILEAYNYGEYSYLFFRENLKVEK